MTVLPLLQMRALRHRKAYRPWAGTWLLAALSLIACPLHGADLPGTLSRVKPAIVAIGTHMPMRQPPSQLRGTGFVISGNYAVTNSHVLPRHLSTARREEIAIFLPQADGETEMRIGQIKANDPEHDLAVVQFDGPPLPSLRLGRSNSVREGQSAAFTGFPILNVLGLYPATHRATVAAISPVVIPAGNARQLTPAMLARLQDRYDVFQLDAVAYPGNSGSPLYDINTGLVIGVINSTVVKETKESAITAPSGISYAIPVSHLRQLLRQTRVPH